MASEMLNKLSDSEVEALIADAQELLKKRDRERKDKAIADARTLLASVGLSMRDLKGSKAERPKTAYHGGHTYQHPVNKALIWNAKGKKPNWLIELEDSGGKPVEIEANDNGQVRKAG